MSERRGGGKGRCDKGNLLDYILPGVREERIHLEGGGGRLGERWREEVKKCWEIWGEIK